MDNRDQCTKWYLIQDNTLQNYTLALGLSNYHNHYCDSKLPHHLNSTLI